MTQVRTFRFSDGATVELATTGPEDPVAVVVMVPALGVRASYYDSLALSLAERRVSVLRADLRGHGSSNLRARAGDDFGYRRLADDVSELLFEAKQVFPDARVVAAGHSLGAQLSLLAAARAPDRVDRVVLLAAGTPYFRNFSGLAQIKVRLAAELVRTTSLLGFFPGGVIGFGGDEASHLMNEWAEFARTGSLVVDGVPSEPLLARISHPILGVTIEGDWMAGPRCMDQLVAKCSKADVTRVLIRRAELPSWAQDHLRWAKEPAPVASAVAEWLATSNSHRRAAE